MHKIKFGEINIGETARRNLEKCLSDNWVTAGQMTRSFEEELAKLFRCKYSVAVNSGTSAVQAMCMALYDFGAVRGESEVICPALSFVASASAILASGLKVRFVDVDRKTLNINPDLIEENINENTVAILPVCLMGKPYDVKRIRETADLHGLPVLADCCESHGATVDGKYIEEYADMCAYSFYSAHVVFAVQMGAVTSNHEKFREPLRSIRMHGRNSNSLYFDHVRLGYNFNPTDLHASIGLEGLEQFQDNFEIRRRNRYYMKTQLAPIADYVYFSEEEPHEVNSPHAVSIVLKDPKYDIKSLEKKLNDAGVETKRNFGSIPSHGAFSFMNIEEGSFPEAEIAGEGIHFACHRYLLKDDMDTIIEIILKHFGKNWMPSYG